MSLTTRLFARRTPYIIDVVDTSAPKQAGRSSWAKLSGLGHKTLAGTFIALLVGSGLAAGLMTYTEKAPAARADWLSDMVCVGSLTDDKDNLATANATDKAKYITDFSAYAGSSTSMQGNRSGNGGVAGNNTLVITDPTINDVTLNGNGQRLQKNAYEIFGANDPAFDSWYGAYDHDATSDDKNTYFYGSGGQAYVQPTGTTSNGNTSNDEVAKGIVNNKDNALGSPTTILGAKKGYEVLLSHGAGDCISLAKSFGVGFSNLVFVGAKSFVGLTNSVYDWAISLADDDPRNPIYQATNAAENLVVGTGHKDGLKDQLYLDFLPPILMIGAIGLFYSGVVRGRSRSAFGSALWMILATLMGFLFVTKPMIVPDIMNTVVTKVQGALTQAILGGSTTAGTGGASTKSLCGLDGASDKQVVIGTTQVDGKAVNVKTSPNYVRETQCSVWYATVYQPWVTGQFGVSATSYDALHDSDSVLNRDPRRILASTSITLGNQTYKGNATDVNKKLTWPLYMLAAQSHANVNLTGNVGVQPSSTNNISEVAYAQLTDSKTLSPDLKTVTAYRTGDAAMNGLWAGDDWSARQLGSAFLALIGSIATTIFILASSLMLVGLQFTTIFLIATSPLFFLLGVAPGWGRRVLMRWVELVVEIVIKRIMVTLMLALFVKFFLIIVSLETAYIFKLIAIGILAFIAIFQRKKLTDMFTDAIKFGGNRDIMTGEGSSMAKGLTMAAVGAGLAALTGGASAPVTGAMVSASNLVEGGKNKKATAEPTPVPTGDEPTTGGPSASAKAESKVEVNVDNGGSGGGGRRPVRVGGAAAGAAGAGLDDDDDLNMEAPGAQLLDEEDETLFGGAGSDAEGSAAAAPTRSVIPGAGTGPSREFDRRAFNKKARRKARWDAAKRGAMIGFSAGKSGSITPLTALNAINAGRDMNKLQREKGETALAKKSAEIANHAATERGVIQLEETRRANDIAEARLEFDKTQAQAPIELEFEDGEEPLRRSDMPNTPPRTPPTGGSQGDGGYSTANADGYREPEGKTWDTDPNGPAYWTESMDREAAREKAESKRRDEARDAADDRDRTARRTEEARREDIRQRDQRAAEAKRRTEEATRKTNESLRKVNDKIDELKRGGPKGNGDGPAFPRTK